MDDFHETPPVEKRCGTCRFKATVEYKGDRVRTRWWEPGIWKRDPATKRRARGKLACMHPDVGPDIDRPLIVLDMAVCSEWQPEPNTDA